MVLFGGLLSITKISFLVFCVFLIAGLGYLLGRITIKGVSLGTAGVFIVALLFGAFLYNPLAEQLKVGDATYVVNALKIVENLGLILFVTSVGFIAGPNFFGDFKRNFKSYILIGLLIILIGGLSCYACTIFDIKIYGRDPKEAAAMLVGLLSGSLTSTPAFSAAKATVVGDSLEAIVAVGHGIAYLFGVVGVVLFVQLVPKFCKANMEEERAKLSEANPEVPSKLKGTELQFDSFGFCVFAIAAILGVIVGSFKFKNFSLTTTGGCLLVSLILGHFAKIGNVSITPAETTLKVFR
jgi:putative transport protein